MTDRLRVASFNVRTSRGRDGRDRWRRRCDVCVEAICGLDADVVGLQEVRPDQLSDLRRAFPHAQLLGAGRDADGGGEHAGVLVRSGVWSVESAETRWLSLTPDVPGSHGWDADLPRVVTLVRLRHGSNSLGIANTHFDHRGTIARERSAQLVVEWLDAERDRPWILLGDLNDDPDAPSLRVFADAGFVDALASVAGGTEHAFTGATDRRRIDYVLTDSGVTVRRAWISHERPRGRLPSDHWPVVADVSV